MNARFREDAAGLESEALAEQIRVSWDPLEDTSVIDFQSTRFLRAGDEYITRMEGDSGVSLTGEQLALKSYEIGGKTITGEDVDMFARMLYDELYNEQHGPQPEEEGNETT